MVHCFTMCLGFVRQDMETWRWLSWRKKFIEIGARHAMQGGTWGGTRVGGRKRGENVGNGLYCRLHGKGKARQAVQTQERLVGIISADPRAQTLALVAWCRTPWWWGHRDIPLMARAGQREVGGRPGFGIVGFACGRHTPWGVVCYLEELANPGTGSPFLVKEAPDARASRIPKIRN